MDVDVEGLEGSETVLACAAGKRVINEGPVLLGKVPNEVRFLGLLEVELATSQDAFAIHRGILVKVGVESRHSAEVKVHRAPYRPWVLM